MPRSVTVISPNMTAPSQPPAGIAQPSRARFAREMPTSCETFPTSRSCTPRSLVDSGKRQVSTARKGFSKSASDASAIRERFATSKADIPRSISTYAVLNSISVEASPAFTRRRAQVSCSPSSSSSTAAVSNGTENGSGSSLVGADRCLARIKASPLSISACCRSQRMYLNLSSTQPIRVSTGPLNRRPKPFAASIAFPPVSDRAFVASATFPTVS